VVNVTKSYDAGTVTSTSGAAGLYGFSFVLSSLNDYSTWQGVYDQYHIKSVEAHFIPCTLAAAPSSTPSSSYLAVAIDLDSAGAPSTVAEVLNYSSHKFAGPGEGIITSFRPHMAQALYGSGVFTSYGNVPSSWIDIASPDVTHYGLRVGVLQSPTTNVNTWRVVVRLHVAFRSDR